MKRFVVAALGLGSLLASQLAAADVITWDFGSGSNCANPSLCFGNTRNTLGSDGSSVEASAWANSVGSANTDIEDAYLAVWSGGLGAYNRDYANGTDAGENASPEHAIDNNGRYEMALFTFAQMTELTSLEIGWRGDDSDMSVLAWTGAGAPPSTTGMEWGDLIGAGWTLVGQYADVAVNTWRDINEAGYASRYWLIGAHNPTFGGSAFSSSNDAIKLSGLAGLTTITVDEPLTFGLLSLGLVMLAARRRR